MSQVIDVFSYNGESEILDLRLAILGDQVDQFVICEGRETTAGVPKELYFKPDDEKYARYNIKYHIFSPFTDPIMQAFSQAYLPIPVEQHWWHREFIQKESMRFALTHLKDEDRVFIGDVDEIWNPTIFYPKGRWELQQTVYTYYLNNKSSEYWTGTSLMHYSDIKNDTLDNLRAYDEARKHMRAPVIPNAGWHFTNQGGIDFIKRKMMSYAHQEYATPQAIANMEYCFANNLDYLGRPFTLGVDESEWPTYLKENRSKYQHLLK